MITSFIHKTNSDMNPIKFNCNLITVNMYNNNYLQLFISRTCYIKYMFCSPKLGNMDNVQLLWLTHYVLTNDISIIQTEQSVLGKREQVTVASRMVLNQHIIPTKHSMLFWCRTSCLPLKWIYLHLKIYDIPLFEFTICVWRNSYGLAKTEICINTLISSPLDR